MNRKRPALVAIHLAFAAFMLAPLVAVALVSFTDKGYISLPFSGASLRWYSALLASRDFIDCFWRSVGLATAAATISTVIAVPAGLAIAWYQFPGRSALLAVLLAPLMVPPVVLGLAILRFLTEIGASSTLGGLAMAHCAIVLPYVLRLVVAAATGFDRTISQAASSLGASAWTTFRRVELPLVAPGVVGGWLIAFITSFDELTMTLFVSSASTETLPVKMYNHISHTIDPLVASISTILLLMTLILMLVLDRLYGIDKLLAGKSR